MKKRMVLLILFLLLFSLLVGCTENEPPQGSDLPTEEESTPMSESLSESTEKESSAEPTESESESEPAESEPQSEPAESESETEPAESESQSEPAESEPQSEPAESESETEPAESESQSEPAESESETEPVESESQSEPAESESETTPAESESETEPVESEPIEKMPLADFPEISETAEYNWLQRTLEKHDCPQTLAELPIRDASAEALFAIPDDGSQSQIATLSDLQKKVGLDYLFLDARTGNYAYTVTKLYDTELGLEKYVYCKFQRTYDTTPEGRYSTEQWNLKEQYVISRSFSFVDIALITKGSPLSELAALDPAFEKALLASPSLVSAEYFELLLVDGLAKISTEISEESEQRHIQTIGLFTPKMGYSPYYDESVSAIPIPEERIELPPDTETKLPMSQFPDMLHGNMAVGWLAATLRCFEQPSLDELPARSANLAEYHFGHFFGGEESFNNSVFWGLPLLQSWIGLDYIELLDENHACTVTKFFDDTTGTVKYVYAIFERELYENENDSCSEQWKYTSECYVVDTIRTMDAFSHISVGSAVTELFDVVPALRPFTPIAPLSTEFLIPLKEGFLKIQTDGVYYEVEIDYQIPVTITALSFHPYGEELTVNGVDVFLAVSPVLPPFPEENEPEAPPVNE